MKGISYGGNVIRNLIGHIWPTKRNNMWRWGVAQVLKRIEQFDGQRVISVVTDNQSHSLDEVKREFKGMVTDFLHFKNDRTRGESISFGPLLHRVNNIDPRQITYYFHAKGCRYFPKELPPQVKPWVDLMHASCLDYPNLIEDKLFDHVLAGSIKRLGVTFGKQMPSELHYAGTFYWFRNAYVFSNPNWHHVAIPWWGAEAWPGVVAPTEGGHTLVHEFSLQDNLNPRKPDMYDIVFWNRRLSEVWKNWQIKYSPLHRFSTYREVLSSLQVLKANRILVTGPQRSGTNIAAAMLAKSLNYPLLNEDDFGVHDVGRFIKMLSQHPKFIMQCPTMSRYIHEMKGCHIVWMRRNLQDVLRSQERINWGPNEKIETERHFDRTGRASAVVKTESWDLYQRPLLGDMAYDLDYESLAVHEMWVKAENRKTFSRRQVGVGYAE